jgi:putative transposase
MARPLRFGFPGAIYHIISRGNDREDISLDDKDREVFLSVLTDTVDRYNWLCYVCCLMDNHYHLLIETPAPTLSLGMRQLNGVYTHLFNRNHNNQW